MNLVDYDSFEEKYQLVPFNQYLIQPVTYHIYIVSVGLI